MNQSVKTHNNFTAHRSRTTALELNFSSLSRDLSSTILPPLLVCMPSSSTQTQVPLPSYTQLLYALKPMQLISLCNIKHERPSTSADSVQVNTLLWNSSASNHCSLVPFPGIFTSSFKPHSNNSQPISDSIHCWVNAIKDISRSALILYQLALFLNIRVLLLGRLAGSVHRACDS